MRVLSRHFDTVLELEPRQFADSRGVFRITYSHAEATDLGISTVFFQDNESLSAKAGTVRGVHFQTGQHAQGKLVRVLDGRILDVIVDIRPDSATLGQWAMLELSAAAANQVWVPAGFGHGFCTMEDNTRISYKVDAPYSPEHEGIIAWDDSELGIGWPVSAEEATLSDKDRLAQSFSAYLSDPTALDDGAR